MPSHQFQWNSASLKGLPQNSKRQTGSYFWSFWGEIDDPPWFCYIFTKGSAIISGKSRKFSLQLYLTYGHESLYTYFYIFSECKEQAWADVIDSLSINGREYVATFLAIEICSNFKVKYLPLPQRYDNNWNVPFLSNHSSLKNMKKIFGHCVFFASGIIWKLHLEQAYFNFICLIIQGINGR